MPPVTFCGIPTMNSFAFTDEHRDSPNSKQSPSTRAEVRHVNRESASHLQRQHGRLTNVRGTSGTRRSRKRGQPRPAVRAIVSKTQHCVESLEGLQIA